MEAKKELEEARAKLHMVLSGAAIFCDGDNIDLFIDETLNLKGENWGLFILTKDVAINLGLWL